jgi:hypothetical protein
MPVTIPLPPDVETAFQAEARERGQDASAYTRQVIETLASAFTANPPEDEHQALLLMSRLENELPRAWKKAAPDKLLGYGFLLLLTWLSAEPKRSRKLTEAISVALVGIKKQEADFPAGGFAAHIRRAREASGDFRSGSEILDDERRAEEDARNIALWGAERGGEINRWQRQKGNVTGESG